MKYFLITADEDGEWSVDVYENMESVADDIGLDDPVSDFTDGSHPAQTFREELDDYNPGRMLIKGDLLMPKAKEVVKKWEFE